MSDNKIMLDLLKEVRDEQKEQGKSLVQMQTDTARNADSLEEHMRRTDALELLHKDNEERIEALEVPGQTRAQIIKWVKIVGIIAGTIVAVTKIAGLF